MTQKIFITNFRKQVKILHDADSERLEQKVNEFLEIYGDAIIDIKYQANGEHYPTNYSVMIFYRI